MMKPHVKLTFPAPVRDSIKTENGWVTVPWTKERMEEYKRIGGWFLLARTDYEGKAAEPKTKTKIEVNLS